MSKRLFALLLTLLLAACNGGDTGGGGQPSGGTGDGTGGGTPPTDPTPTTTVLVRPNLKDLDPNGPEIATLRQGVAAMQAKPATDPLSWLYQANMHGTYDTPVQTAWNTCQHGSWFFLSWHRMYLYYLERILRQAAGDPNLALPFWDYTDPTQRALPLAYRQPQTDNALFVAQRAQINPINGQPFRVNDGAQLPPSAVAIDNSLGFTNFFSPTGSGLSFGGQQLPNATHFAGPHGQIESQPHDIIHVLVGGVLDDGSNGWMIDPNLAARDPIFYAHHANIDRLWNVWLERGNTNPLDQATWADDVKFTFFDVGPAGEAVEVTMTGRQVVDSAAQLNYRYAAGSGDGPSPQAEQRSAAETAALVDEDRTEVASADGGSLGASRTALAIEIPPARPEAEGDRPLTLLLEDVDFGRPGLYYEVYLNLPEGSTPDAGSPHYVGNLAIFGHHSGDAGDHGDHGDHGGDSPDEGGLGTLHYDISRVVRRLEAAGGWDGKLQLSFVPVALEPAEGQAAPESEAAPPRSVDVKIGKVRVVQE